MVDFPHEHPEKGEALSPDIDLLVVAKTIWGEARGEGQEGMHAVACVIVNRVAAVSWYGRTPAEVCLKEKQFSCWNMNDPNRMLLEKPLDIWLRWKGAGEAQELAKQVINKTLTDTTGGANHYHHRSIRPKWADDSKVTARIKNHIFYKL